MKLINNIIVTKKSEGYLLINSLNGLIDSVDYSTLGVIEKWSTCDSILPMNDVEMDLYRKLKSRGYLCNSHEEENSQKKEIIASLSKNHSKMKSNNSHITFVMTYDCNFRCPYCFECSPQQTGCELSSDNKSFSEPTMTPEIIDAAFQFIGDSLKTIGLFGGEPLLPKNLKAIEYIINKAPDKTYDITTNGYYLDLFLPLLKKINISYVMVTIDGDEHTHNSRRYLENGAPTFSKIINNIEKCLMENIPIRIRMNIDEDNVNQGMSLRKEFIDRFSDFKKNLSFEISPMMEMDHSNRNLVLRDLYKSDCILSNTDEKQKNQLLGRFSPILNMITTGTRLKPIYSFCTAHDTGLILDPYGYIYPCLVSVGKKQYAIGKFYPHKEYFENSIRTRNIDNIPECSECSYSLLCGGGCPLNLSDSSDLCKPECYSIKNQIHNILPLLYSINS